MSLKWCSRAFLLASVSFWSASALANSPALTVEEASRLAAMPLHCTQVEYPNKLNQVLATEEYLKGPKDLHPAFYGCFDWHSSVHGHWMIVNLLRHFPQISEGPAIRDILKTNISKSKIEQEVAFFHTPENGNYERIYGWAWLLALAAELHQWDDPLARELETNLAPLTALMVEKFEGFLPKLVYPIRTGEHPNTAFGLSLAYDYAQVVGDTALEKMIARRATDWYAADAQCPLSWEPNGFDFLSPCFEELNLMRKVMDEKSFVDWADRFLPQLDEKSFSLEPAKVGDRSDGKLVHLDGLNFSRAWTFYGMAKAFPERYGHLRAVGDAHVNSALPSVVDNNYQGTHWLGSFAVYALQQREGL